MKLSKQLLTAAIVFAALSIQAQVQINKPIQLTGGTGERVITNLETPVNGTDAVNKDYVDAAVAASGGSGMPTHISDESGTNMTLGDAARYCNALNESGFTDWRLPSLNELMYATSMGGITVSNNTSGNYVWFHEPHNYGSGSYAMWAYRLSNGGYTTASYGGTSVQYVRCVR